MSKRKERTEDLLLPFAPTRKRRRAAREEEEEPPRDSSCGGEEPDGAEGQATVAAAGRGADAGMTGAGDEDLPPWYEHDEMIREVVRGHIECERRLRSMSGRAKNAGDYWSKDLTPGKRPCEGDRDSNEGAAVVKQRREETPARGNRKAETRHALAEKGERYRKRRAAGWPFKKPFPNVVREEGDIRRRLIGVFEEEKVEHIRKLRVNEPHKMLNDAFVFPVVMREPSIHNENAISGMESLSSPENENRRSQNRQQKHCLGTRKVAQDQAEGRQERRGIEGHLIHRGGTSNAALARAVPEHTRFQTPYEIFAHQGKPSSDLASKGVSGVPVQQSVNAMHHTQSSEYVGASTAPGSGLLRHAGSEGESARSAAVLSSGEVEGASMEELWLEPPAAEAPELNDGVLIVRADPPFSVERGG